MIGALLRVLDEVRTEDGTLAVIDSFAEIDHSYESGTPGIYENREWVRLCGLEGPGKGGYFPVARLTLEPAGEYEKRYATWKGANDPRSNPVYLRPLPETEFWEGDWIEIVTPNHPRRGRLEKVVHVQYLESPTTYHVGDDGSYMFCRASDLKLRRRGGIWAAYQAAQGLQVVA